MDLQAMRGFARGALDLDAEDLPDTIVDVFIREGTKRIRTVHKEWPFLEATASLATVASQRDYARSAIATDIDLNDIAFVLGPNWPLKHVDRSTLDRLYPADVIPSGSPTYFSVWGTVLRLLPTPNAVESLTVRYYRTPVDFTAQGSGAEPDLPADFHEPIAMWAASLAASREDEQETSAFFKRLFDEAVQALVDRYADGPSAAPLVLSGTRTDVFRANGVYIPGSGYLG